MVEKKCQTCDEIFEAKGNIKRCDYCRGLKQREPKVEPPKSFKWAWGLAAELKDKVMNSKELATTKLKGYHPDSQLVEQTTGLEAYDDRNIDIKNPYSNNPFKPIESKRDELRKIRSMRR